MCAGKIKGKVWICTTFFFNVVSYLFHDIYLHKNSMDKYQQHKVLLYIGGPLSFHFGASTLHNSLDRHSILSPILSLLHCALHFTILWIQLVLFCHFTILWIRLEFFCHLTARFTKFLCIENMIRIGVVPYHRFTKNYTGKISCSLVLKLKVYNFRVFTGHTRRCITRAALFFKNVPGTFFNTTHQVKQLR